MAVKKPKNPRAFNSKLMVAPKSPAMIPSGSPKFRPHPDCTMGTIARTKTPFMPNLTRVSLIDESIRTFTNGARTKRDNKNRAMMALGHPMSAINFLILSN